MTQLQFSNNGKTTLAANLSSTATTVALAAGAGALLPIPTQGQGFKLVFRPAATGTFGEVVLVTGMSGDTITSMVRGQEGTTAVAWSLGDLAALENTAGTQQNFVQADQFAALAQGLIVGGNLFNYQDTTPSPNGIVLGHTLNISTGAPSTVNSGFNVSHYFPVFASQNYSCGDLSGFRGVHVCIYDLNKTFVGAISSGSTQTSFWTSPVNGFARVDYVASVPVTQFMAVPGNSVPAIYAPFGTVLEANPANGLAGVIASGFDSSGQSAVVFALSSAPSLMIQPGAIDPAANAFLVQSGSLFNYVLAGPVGFALNTSTGGTFAQAGYRVSQYIPINGGFPSQISIGASSTHICWYDANKAFIPPAANSGSPVLNSTLTAPTNARFWRADSVTTTLMIVYGATVPGSFSPAAYGFNPAYNIPAAYFPWAGKRFGVTGDSQTANGNWQVQFLAATRMSMTLNDGVAGRVMANAAANLTSGNTANIDLLLNEHGTNDWAGGTVLGTIADGAGVASFYGYMASYVATALGLNPAMNLVFVIPSPRFAPGPSPFTQPVPPALNSQGLGFPTYCDAMRQFCQANSIPFVDLYNRAGFNAFNSQGTTMAPTSLKLLDGLHWNAAQGGPDVARIMAGVVNSLV